MNRRSFRIVLLGVIATLAAGEITAQAVEESLPELSDWPTLEIQVKAEQLQELGALPDVLVVGSSVTESGLDPAQLLEVAGAASAYNAAFPFYSPAAAQIWLDEFVDPWGEVEILLIGLPAWPPPQTPGHDPLARALEDLANQAATPHPLDRFALWRLRGVVNELDEALSRERAIARGRWTELGHQTYWHEHSGETFNGHGDYGPPEMAAHQQEALQRIVAAARSANTKPVIVIEPGRFSGSATDATIEEYLASLEKLADDLEVELWNAYAVDWDPALFADGTHFNHEGTRAYTRYIATKLGESLGAT
jgi:hypothetical protein